MNKNMFNIPSIDRFYSFKSNTNLNKDQLNPLKEEDGRSMVEILGVLAIIGVLSVGGLYAYTSAMTRHRANELLHEINKRITWITSQLQTGNEANISDFGDYDSYSFQVKANDANHFWLTVRKGREKIDRAICLQMKNALGKNVQNFGAKCDGTDDQIILAYNDDLSTEEKESTGNQDGTCLGGYTGPRCDQKVVCENGTWTEEGCECEEGWFGKTCDSDCDGLKDKAGNCQRCPSAGGGTLAAIKKFTEAECARCGGFLDGVGMVCYSCSRLSGVITSSAKCDYCHDSGHPRIMDGDKCVPDDCPGFWSDTGGCYACSTPGGITTTTEECNRCSTTREMINEYCALKCNENPFFRDSQYYCRSCTDPNPYSSSASECNKCGATREMINGYCAPLICNENKFRDSQYYCRSCTDPNPYSSSASECNRCSTTREMINEYCARKCNENQFRDSQYYCRSCTDSIPYSSSASECNKCNGTREMVGTNCARK